MIPKEIIDKAKDNAEAIKDLIKAIGYDGFAVLVEYYAEDYDPCKPGEFIQAFYPWSWERFSSLKQLRDKVDKILDTKDVSDQEFVEIYNTEVTNNGLFFLGTEVIAFMDF
jgi:hypothetical protein